MGIFNMKMPVWCNKNMNLNTRDQNRENGRDEFTEEEEDIYEEEEEVNPRTIYEELKPIHMLSRIFGFASFRVLGNKAQSSNWFVLVNLFYALIILYATYTAVDATEGHMARSALSRFFFKVIAVCRNAYAIICLIQFMVNAKTCIEVWTFIEDINEILRAIGIEIDYRSNKRWNYATTAIFLGVFSCFSMGYAATMTELPSLKFCILFFLPLFNSYLLVFYFTMLTTNLKKKCRLMNTDFREEIELYKARRDRKKSLDFLEDHRKTVVLLRKVRALKMVHLKMYKVVKMLNSLFGYHFLYMFVMFFCLGSLHSFTIIRHISVYVSQALFLESILTITMECAHITLAVYGGIILNTEIRRTIILVHKFLTMTDREDVNLENELQSFCIQLHQCGLSFSASGFFSMDFTMLFQFIVAFFSNAVFFLQVDSMSNSRN